MEARLSQVKWSPDGKMIAVGDANGVLTLLRFTPVATGFALRQSWQNRSQRGIASILWTSDGRHILTSTTGDGPSITQWDLSGKAVYQHDPKISVPSMASCFGNDEFIFIDLYGQSVLSGKCGQVFSSNLISKLNRQGYSIAISPSGLKIAVGQEKQLLLVDKASGQIEATLSGHKECIDTLSWSPNGNRLASSSRFEPKARLWDLQNNTCIWETTSSSSGVNDIAWFSDGKQLVICQTDGPGEVWDVNDQKKSFEFRDEGYWETYCVSVNSDGYIAAGSQNGRFCIWRNGGLVTKSRLTSAS